MTEVGESERRFEPKRIALYTVLLTMLGFYLAPLESGFMTSVKTLRAFSTTSPFVPPAPSQFTTSAWYQAWNELKHGMYNSLLMAIPAAAGSALLGSMAAYGLTKVKWRGQLVLVTLFLAGVFIPYQAVLVPLVTFWADLPLEDLLAGVPYLAQKVGLLELAFTHIAYGVPICTILFRGYYQTIDDEMLEAARLDGASVTGIYRKIVLPLSVPMFAVVLIYQFTNIWNDLLFGLVLITSEQNLIITVALNSLKGSMVQQFNLQMAGAFVAALPTLLVYIMFGEQFADGIAGRR